MSDILMIDGSLGEGGGQMLRTSLSLAAILGRPFEMVKVRAKRPKPGLKRQHLTCVKAVAEICGATFEGDEVGSMRLSFAPGPIRGGDYRFDIGTAGATTLVAQTVIPVLLKADAPSTVVITGGTHVPFAPIWEFLAETYPPELRAMGADIEAELVRYGFYPAGGGEIRLSIKPFDERKAKRDWSFANRGAFRGGRAAGVVSAISDEIAEGEVEQIMHKLWQLGLAQETRRVESTGPGNYCYARLDFDRGSVVFSDVGSFDRSRRAVANTAASAAKHFLSSGAAVELHLADQLLVPAAVLLGRHGTAGEIGIAIEQETLHYTTNQDVIAAFLD